MEDRRHTLAAELRAVHLVVSLSILVAAERKKEALAMVTAVEDGCPNGVREEAEATPPGQPGTEKPPALLSTQEPDMSGGEERRTKKFGVACLD